MRRLTAPLSILLILMMPAVLLSALKDDIRINLEEKQVREMTPQGLSLVFYLNLTNSSRKTYFLSGYAYRFVVNEREYLRLQTPMEQGLRIDPSQTTMIALPVKITYDLLYRAVGDLSGEAMVGCYLMGELAFSDGRRHKGTLPIAFNGEFPIYRHPEVVPTALKARAVTIGGADLLFEMMLRNANGFDIDITRLEYTIKFGGHEVAANQSNRRIPLPAAGDSPQSIPLLLNFFDVGKEIRGLLQQPDLNCRMTGTMELRTPWGRMNVPFDVQVKVPVVSGG